MPQLRPAGQLAQEEGNDALGAKARARQAAGEAGLGQVAGQNAGVVAVALDGSGVGRYAVLSEAGEALRGGSREVDAGYGCAFPVRSLGGEPALAEGG